MITRIAFGPADAPWSKTGTPPCDNVEAEEDRPRSGRTIGSATDLAAKLHLHERSKSSPFAG